MKASSNTLIPERLKSAREQLHLTKAEAARRIGLTAASYVRYESGDRGPSSQVIQSIAESLGTSVAYLTGGTDDRAPDVISVFKNDAPLLFELLNGVQSADEATIQRLLTYYDQIKNKE